MRRLRRRAPASAGADASKAPLGRRLALARRLPIAVIAGLVAAVPAGGSTVVSRVDERPFPDDDPRALSWPLGPEMEQLLDDLAGLDLEDLDLGHLGDFDGEVPRVQLTVARGGWSADPDTVGLYGSDIPTVALQAYVRAARTMAVNDPSCGIEWSLLAAIGRVESNHGRFGGAGLNQDGTTSHPIRGVPLDGRGDVARILDTDGGRLDDDDVYDRAVGPMQFIPSTWRRVAADGNDDGRADPHNIYDAALSAAVYLCAGDVDLRDPTARRQAVLRYNRSSEYAATVLALADAYERSQGSPLPDVGPTSTPPATVGTPTLPPANPGPTPVLRGGASGPGPSRNSGSSGPAGSSGSSGPGRQPTRPTSSPTTRSRPSTPETTDPTGPTSTPPTSTRPPTTATTTSSTTTTTRPTSTSSSSTSTSSSSSSTSTSSSSSSTSTSTTSTSTSSTSSSTTTTSTTTTSTTTTTTTTQPPGPVLHQVRGDQLPGGPWSLWAGGGGPRVTLEMRLPAGTTWHEAGTPEALTGRWTVASADGRHVVWGLTPADVARVAVTLSDGRAVSIPTVEVAIDGVGQRVFAAHLPEGVTITAAEGRRAGGGTAVRAEDVTASLAPVAGFDPTVRATVPVVPATASTEPPDGPGPGEPGESDDVAGDAPAGASGDE